MGLFCFTKHEPVGVVGQIIPVSNLFNVWFGFYFFILRIAQRLKLLSNCEVASQTLLDAWSSFWNQFCYEAPRLKQWQNTNEPAVSEAVPSWVAESLPDKKIADKKKFE